jgi:hypothetical protein
MFKLKMKCKLGAEKEYLIREAFDIHKDNATWVFENDRNIIVKLTFYPI